MNPMPHDAVARSSGVETVKEAFRRSRWIIVFAVVLGVVSVNAFSYLRGATYEATAQVLISDRDLGSAITGSAPAFSDPQRLLDTELALANSAELFRRVAASAQGTLGTESDVEASVRATGGANNIISFTAARNDPRLAVSTANAVATEFPRWRAELAASPIESAISQARARLADDPDNDALRSKLDTLVILRTLSSGNATLAESASSATQTEPNHPRDTVLGIAIGLVVGLVVAGLQQAMDNRLRDEADVEDILELPTLSVLPSLPRGSRLVLFGRHRARFEDRYALLAADVENLLPGEQCHVLGVTASSPREGKSSTIANLGVALTRRGARVAIVDLDLRRPTQHSIFAIPPEAPGVVQMLELGTDARRAHWLCDVEGEAPIPVSIIGVVPESAAETAATGPRLGRLEILPAGGTLPSARAVRLVRAERLQRLLAPLREDFDWLLIDTPPALGSPEMAVIPAIADAMMLVVRRGQVSRKDLTLLRRATVRWPTQTLGFVLTDSPRENAYGYEAE